MIRSLLLCLLLHAHIVVAKPISSQKQHHISWVKPAVITLMTMTGLGYILYEKNFSSHYEITYIRDDLSTLKTLSLRRETHKNTLNNFIISQPSVGLIDAENEDTEDSDSNWMRRRLNVFADDHRVHPKKMTTFPERTIGQLWIPKTSATGDIKFINNQNVIYQTCTATLIGRDLILTNRHCLGLSKQSNQKKLSKDFWRLARLKLGYEFGQSLAESHLLRIHFHQEDSGDHQQDWAILQLVKPLGETYGFLGIKNTNRDFFQTQNRHVNLIGYSGDLDGEPGAHYGCQTHGIDHNTETILHDCDSTQGSSGSSAFQSDHFVIGLHYGAFADRDKNQNIIENFSDFTPQHGNLMIPTAPFIESFQNIREQWQKPSS